VAPGESASGECTILISDSDFIDILSGKLSGQKAFMEVQTYILVLR
jgi:putative sterol carrier protein